MEDVSTSVLEKIKNIYVGKTEKRSDVSRHIELHINMRYIVFVIYKTA